MIGFWFRRHLAWQLRQLRRPSGAEPGEVLGEDPHALAGRRLGLLGVDGRLGQDALARDDLAKNAVERAPMAFKPTVCREIGRASCRERV